MYLKKGWDKLSGESVETTDKTTIGMSSWDKLSKDSFKITEKTKVKISQDKLPKKSLKFKKKQ